MMQTVGIPSVQSPHRKTPQLQLALISTPPLPGRGLLLHLTQDDPVGLLRRLPHDAHGRQPDLWEHQPDGGPRGCKGTQSSWHQGLHGTKGCMAQGHSCPAHPVHNCSPRCVSPIAVGSTPCMCIIYIYSVYKYIFCLWIKASNTPRHQTQHRPVHPTVVFFAVPGALKDFSHCSITTGVTENTLWSKTPSCLYREPYSLIHFIPVGIQ